MTTQTLPRPDVRPTGASLQHFCCGRCYPRPGPATALCGVAMHSRGVDFTGKIPPNVCLVCLDLSGKPCGECPQ